MPTCGNDNASYGDMISVMSRTLAAANRLIARLLADEGIIDLIPSHGDVLMQLFAHDEMTMAALADAIGKDPSTVTALVRKLVDAGYVKTGKDPDDRRITRVSLTDAGRALKPRFAQVSRRLCETMRSELSSAELEAARDSLMKMKESFDKEGRDVATERL